MASIKINDLRPAGSQLFHDSESFLNELNDQELGIFGGKKPIKIKIKTDVVVISQFTISIGVSVASASVVSAVG